MFASGCGKGFMLRGFAGGVFAHSYGMLCILVRGIRFGLGKFARRKLAPFFGHFFGLMFVFGSFFVGSPDFEIAGGVYFFGMFVGSLGFLFVLFFVVKFCAAYKSVGFGLILGFFLLRFDEAGGKGGDFLFA